MPWLAVFISVVMFLAQHLHTGHWVWQHPRRAERHQAKIERKMERQERHADRRAYHGHRHQSR